MRNSSVWKAPFYFFAALFDIGIPKRLSKMARGVLLKDRSVREWVCIIKEDAILFLFNFDFNEDICNSTLPIVVIDAVLISKDAGSVFVVISLIVSGLEVLFMFFFLRMTALFLFFLLENPNFLFRFL